MRADAAKVAPVPVITPQCQATTEVAYAQNKAVAHLEGSIIVKSCPAGSAGAYTIVLSVKSESGETTLAFAESWQPNDRPEVKFTSNYPIGESVELVDVRLRGLSCTCAEVLPGADPEPKPATLPSTE
jgi:hypothetical protein